MMKSVEIEDQCPIIAEEVNHYNKIASLHVQENCAYERALFFLLKALDSSKKSRAKTILSCVFSVRISMKPSH